MDFFLTIKALYAVNGIVALVLYIPQIRQAWRDRNGESSISLLTFGGWGVGSVITSLYAWLLVGDRMWGMVSLGNIIGTGSIFCLVAFSRFSSRSHGVRSGSAAPPIAAGER